MELGFDFDETSKLKELNIQNVPEHYLSIQLPHDTASAQSSAALLIASVNELSEEELLVKTMMAAPLIMDSEGSQLEYDAKTSALPLCAGTVTGYLFEAKSKISQSLKVNIGNNATNECVLLGKVVAPDNAPFGLRVNDKKLIGPDMSFGDRVSNIYGWQLDTDKIRVQSQYMRFSPGLVEVLEQL